MEITQAQFAHIEHCFPTQRGKASLSNLNVLKANESVAKVRRHGPSFRGTATLSGCTHQSRGRFARFHPYQGTSGWHRGAKKCGPQTVGKSRGGWNTKIHMVAADARTTITFSLSPGQAHDAHEGRALLRRLEAPNLLLHLLMGRAYESNETRQSGTRPGICPRRAAAEDQDRALEVTSRINELIIKRGKHRAARDRRSPAGPSCRAGGSTRWHPRPALRPGDLGLRCAAGGHGLWGR